MHFLSAFHLWGSTCDLYFLMNKGALLSTREKQQHENKHLGQCYQLLVCSNEVYCCLHQLYHISFYFKINLSLSPLLCYSL